MLPSQTEAEVPLLRAIAQLGGRAKPKEVYPVVTKFFPQITPEDLAETVSDGHSKWHNRIQWVRQRLVEHGDLESGGWGMWRITPKGEARIAGSDQKASRQSPPTFLELYEKYESSFRAQLLERLLALKPVDFEHFAKRVLMAYGFVDVNVTDVSKANLNRGSSLRHPTSRARRATLRSERGRLRLFSSMAKASFVSWSRRGSAYAVPPCLLIRTY
jgi:restriction system protein